MSSKKDLKAILETILQLEEGARDMYADHLNRFSNKKILKTYKFVHDEEVNHISIVKTMLGLLDL